MEGKFVDMKDFKFLGLEFNNYSIKKAILKIEEYIREYNLKNSQPRMFFSLSAELIVRANKDKELKEIYDKADIITVDGWVVYYFAKLKGNKLIEPASAANIMFQILPIVEEKKYRVYLLGASSEIVEIVNDKLIKQGINVVGYHDGYFDKEKLEDVVDDIKKSNADILFVAMSTPLKENFISKNFDNLNVAVSIGVGGGFDIIAGKCKHAPVWISKIGLEWFYRFIQEPRRLWKRYLITNFLFLFLFVKSYLKK